MHYVVVNNGHIRHPGAKMLTYPLTVLSQDCLLTYLSMVLAGREETQMYGLAMEREKDNKREKERTEERV